MLPSRVLSCVLSAWGAMAHATAEEGAASREATRQAGWRRREPGRWWFGSSAAAGYGPTATVACCYIDEAADAWVLDEVTVVVIVARRILQENTGQEDGLVSRRGRTAGRCQLHHTQPIHVLPLAQRTRTRSFLRAFPKAPGWRTAPSSISASIVHVTANGGLAEASSNEKLKPQLSLALQRKGGVLAPVHPLK